MKEWIKDEMQRQKKEQKRETVELRIQNKDQNTTSGELLIRGNIVDKFC